jgi:hypothetical protein
MHLRAEAFLLLDHHLVRDQLQHRSLGVLPARLSTKKCLTAVMFWMYLKVESSTLNLRSPISPACAQPMQNTIAAICEILVARKSREAAVHRYPPVQTSYNARS